MNKSRESESTLRKSRRSTYVNSFKSIKWAAKKLKESRKMMALQICPIDKDKENTAKVIIQKFGSSKVQWMKLKKGSLYLKWQKKAGMKLNIAQLKWSNLRNIFIRYANIFIFINNFFYIYFINK